VWTSRSATPEMGSVQLSFADFFRILPLLRSDYIKVDSIQDIYSHTFIVMNVRPQASKLFMGQMSWPVSRDTSNPLDASTSCCRGEGGGAPCSTHPITQTWPGCGRCRHLYQTEPARVDGLFPSTRSSMADATADAVSEKPIRFPTCFA